jgi:hypothetical protein
VSAGTFAAFSKFPLNTSKSPNVKIVRFVEGHNFHVEWHLRFEVKRVKTSSQRFWLLFTGAQKTADLACNLRKNGGEKDPTLFVEVVEE